MENDTREKAPMTPAAVVLITIATTLITIILVTFLAAMFSAI